MTKNNFTALAAALKGVKPVYLGPRTDHLARAYHQWTLDVIAIIGVLEQSNPRFRKDKFLDACGVPNLLLK